MKQRLPAIRHSSTARRQDPFFGGGLGRAGALAPRPFIQASPAMVTGGPVIQREEKKDPAAEGAKLTGEKALDKPEVKKALEELWDGLPKEAQVGLMSVGGVSLGIGYLSLILSPKMQEDFSDVDIGKPLSLIPYFPLESFKYKLPAPGKEGLGLSADFAFDDYFSLLRESYPAFPVTNLTFGLQGSLSPGGGFGLTGGKAGVELFGGALKAEGTTFTELSPYPLTVPGSGPFDQPLTVGQSYPELPALKTGFGAQITVSAEVLKLISALGGPEL